MLIYSAAYAAVKKKEMDTRILKPLEKKIPTHLMYQAQRLLSPLFSKTINELDKTLESSRPVSLNEANIKNIVEEVKNKFNSAEYVMVYDCMSLIEFILIAASLKLNHIESIIPDIVFINPIGLTRFVTHQLPNLDHRAVLREFAHILAKELGAHGYYKSAYIDLKVHEYGSLGIEEYIARIDIERIIHEVSGKASTNPILVTADHGYDVIYDTDENYVYVTHGFKEPLKEKHIPLLLLSRFSFFLKAFPER